MAWTRVQQSASQATNGTGTLPANSTAGNLLIAVAGCSSTTAITPPANWTSIVTITGTSSEVTIFAYFNTVGGQSSFAFTGGASPISVSIAEYNCPNVSSVTAASGTGTITGNKVSTVTVTNAATEHIGDLVIVGATEHLATASAITWTDPANISPYTSLATASANQHTYGGDALIGSGASQAETFTSSVAATTNLAWTGVIASFTPVGSPYSQGRPAKARQPLPRRGIVRTMILESPVQNPSQGPAFNPLRYPARARIPQIAPRGRTSGNRGAPVQNPVVLAPAPFPHPARTVIPQISPRGRVQRNAGAPVQNPSQGPRVYPLQGPARVRLPQLAPRAGRVAFNAGAPVQNPSQGSAVKPLAGPVQAKRPLFLLGRAAARPGAPAQNPTQGPPFKAFTQPFAIRRVLPPRGRTTSNAGAPVFVPPAALVVFNLHQPVRSRLSQVAPRGRVASNPGAPVQNPTAGPHVYPLQGSVRARLPQLHPRTGYVAGNAGAPVRNPSQGPVFRLPVEAVLARRFLPPRGRVAGNVGAPVQNPVSGTGPAFYPFRQPARSRITPPPRGRVVGNAGAPVHNPSQGPAFYSLRFPVRGSLPQPRAGRTATTRVVPAVAVTPVVLVTPALSSPAGIRIIVVRTGHSQASQVSNPPAPPVARRLTQPVRAPIPQASGGRKITGSQGAPVSNPNIPAAKPYWLARPVHAPFPRPARGGRTAGSLGAPVTAVVFTAARYYPPTQPVRARWPLTAPGRAATMGSLPGPVSLVTANAGPPVYPLRQPTRSRITPPLRGHVVGNLGAPVRNPTTGPPATPLRSPVQGRLPRLQPRAGRAYSNPGAPVQNPTAKFYQATSPARARILQIALRGRTSGNPGALAAAAVQAPRFYLPSKALHAQPPVFIKGRITSSSGAPVRNPLQGPPVYPLRRPVSAVYPYWHPRAGGATAHTLPYVAPFIPPPPAGGHGYPYSGILNADRWPAQLRSTFWLAAVSPDRYEAVSMPTTR